jgi:hypothetical protein
MIWGLYKLCSSLSVDEMLFVFPGMRLRLGLISTVENPRVRDPGGAIG